MEGSSYSQMAGGSRKRAASPILDVLTAMAFVSNFRPSQEDAVRTNSGGGGGSNNFNDIDVGATDFNDIDVDYHLSQDVIEEYNPELYRILDEVERNVVEEAAVPLQDAGPNVGGVKDQGKFKEPIDLPLPAFARKNNADVVEDSGDEFQPPKKSKNSPGPSRISRPAPRNNRSSKKGKAAKSKKGDHRSILRNILEEPAPLTPSVQKKSKKGKEPVVKSRPQHSIHRLSPVNLSDSSDEEQEIFSQIGDRDIFSNFGKLLEKVKRERAEKTSARAGDDKLRDTARRAILLAKQNIEASQKKIQEENEKIKAEEQTISHYTDLLTGADEREVAEAKAEKKLKVVKKQCKVIEKILVM